MNREILILFMTPSLTMRWLRTREDGIPMISLGSARYVHCAEMAALYDILLDNANVPAALQLHIYEGEEAFWSQFASPEHRRRYLDNESGFATIWLGERRPCAVRGLEAFGVFFFRDDKGTVAVALEIDNWVTDDEKALLRSMSAPGA